MTLERSRHDNWLWAATITIWALGCWPFYWLWYARPFENRIGYTLSQATVYFLGFWYFLALGPIRGFLGRLFKERPPA